MFGAQVGPNDAELNLCKWPKAIFWNVPDHCLAHLSNGTFYTIAFGLLVGGLIWLAWPWIILSVKKISRAKHSPLETQAEPDASSHYMTAYEVIHYLADETEWGKKCKNQPAANGMSRMPLFEAPAEFKRIAENGRIRAFGRLNGSGGHVEIPAHYWMSAVISAFSIDNPSISQTMPCSGPNRDGIPIYKDVKIARVDVEESWPKARLAKSGSV